MADAAVLVDHVGKVWATPDAGMWKARGPPRHFTYSERLLALRDDVGLLAEEYDQVAKPFLGTFPQAFSHVALTTTAMNLSEREKPVEQRAETKARD